jgi:hypothetical protein
MQIYSYRIGVLVPVTSAGDERPAVPDITGFDVEATDGHIGKVDEATYEESASWLIVDTGFWIFGKKRMIPASAVVRVDPDEKKVFVDMTKEEIKAAPDYDAERHRSDEAAYREEVGRYYDSMARR